MRIRERDGRGRGMNDDPVDAGELQPVPQRRTHPFGPDGKLYAIVGDGHSARNAQDVTGNLRGKILRMNPDGSAPGSNPMIGGRRSRIFAFGIRNSFGFAFDPETGNLWETENGPECNDEINLVLLRRQLRVGTRARAARTRTRTAPRRGDCPRCTFSNPIGITGAAFCDGCGLPGREGDLLFGDCCDGGLLAARHARTVRATT